MIGKKINQLATELAPESTDLTIIGDPTTGVSKKITIAQLGAIFSGAVSFYTNLAAFPVTGDINVIYCAKDTQKLYLWSGSAYVEVFPSQALLDTYQLRSEKGNANGYASLDSLGKVPISQLPSSIMEYKGTWNAATNTPTLANGTGDTGDVYICNVAGTVNFGAGPITFAVGDYVIYSGTIWQRSSGAVGTVTSVAASITGNSVSISGSPIVTSGTLAFAFAGNATQYVRGDGQLATLPTNGGGGGASVSYYLNGSINQGTIGGVTYYEMNKTPIIGAGTDFTRNSNGYIASFLTDANDPALLNIPAGNFNFETYFEASSGGGSPTFYIELYKYDGTNFTLIASNSTSPKLINDATNIEAYFSALAVPQTTLTLTDRLAIRIYVTTAGRTITLHTENNTLCQVITTFTTGLTALNGLTSQVQYLATGTSGTDFNIASASATHTFNLPTASATNRGALSSADWTTFNNKQNVLTLTTTGSSGDATLVGATLNIPNYGSALTGYVPYTGATGNVNLGTNDFLTRSVFIEGATNYQAGLLMKQYSVYNFVTGAYTQIAPSTATELNIVHNQANTTRRRYALSVAALQDGDTFQYLVPRASGTLALTSDLTGGTVTSVAALTIGTSGTDLSSTVANGTTTPVITLNVPTASATNRGALSSTDWTTFNNKQNALTNPVTGTGTNNYIPKFTTTGSTIGNSQIIDNGTTVSIGSTALSQKFVVVGGNGNQMVLDNTGQRYTQLNFNNNGTQRSYLATDNTSNLFEIYGSAGYSLSFGTDGGQKMLLNTSGNLGLGVTPSAWASGTEGALQVGAASIYKYSTYESGYSVNAYYNAGWKYINTDIASQYKQTSGQHIWYNAPSGTAGNAISFTQAMTLNASGNLGIAETNPLARLMISGDSADMTGTITYSTNTKGIILNQDAGGGQGMGIWFRQAGLTAGIGSTRVSNGDWATDLRFYTHPAATSNQNILSERMRINSEGNVGIGTTDPQARLDVTGSDNAGSTLSSRVYSANRTAFLGFGYAQITASSNSGGLTIEAAGANPLIFNTNSGERMRITSGGYLKASNTGSYFYSTNPFYYFENSAADWTLLTRNTSASSPNGIAIQYSAAAPNNNSNWMFYATDSSGLKFGVMSNGGIVNFQANNQNLSDIRTKKDIAPLESYWDKFKAIEMVKFKYKDQTHDDFNIGVIAQQVEKVAPEFVDVDGWGDTQNDKDPLKSIYTSDLHHATIKVLQEAMAKIEDLQNQLDTLKNK